MGAGHIRGAMKLKSAMVKRSTALRGRRTSVSLEDAFWAGLKEIASERAVPLRALVAEIAAKRTGGNLSSAVRLYVLDYYQRRASFDA